MRASTAYFAGAGTIIVAIVAGLGGGLVIADIMGAKSPKPGTEMTRLERRMSPEPIKAAEAPPEPVPYLAAAQPSAPGAAVAAAPVPAQPQTEVANSAPAQPADTPAAVQPASPAPQVAAAPAASPAAQEKAAAPEVAFAKARDADVRRAEEKRSTERRQQWAERRRQRQQQELKAVEDKVREDTEPKQQLTAEPVRIEMPLIRLFGPD